jgi:hypothetical protein
MQRSPFRFAKIVSVALAVTITAGVPTAMPQTLADIKSAIQEIGVHQFNGDIAKATAAATRAVSMAEALYGPSHPIGADTLEYLALATGDKSHFLRALSIREAAQGEIHKDTARTLGLLSLFVFSEPEAEPYLKRVVALHDAKSPAGCRRFEAEARRAAEVAATRMPEPGAAAQKHAMGRMGRGAVL